MSEDQVNTDPIETADDGDPYGSLSDVATATPAETQDAEPEPAEQVDDPPSDAEPEGDQTVPLKAHAELRAKKREAEEKTAELERKIAFMEGKLSSNQPQAQAEPTEDDLTEQFYENPTEFIKKQVGSVREQVIQDKIAMSVELTKAQFDDYADREAVFMKQAEKNPGLVAQMRENPNPALFAYNYAKQVEAAADVGSVDELKAKLSAEIEAKLRKELNLQTVKGAPKSGAATGRSKTNQAQIDDNSDPYAGLNNGF